MTSIEVLGGRRDASVGYKVDISRGQRVSRVSSEWFSRPADERFLSLSELFATVRSRAERGHTRTVESAAIKVDACRDNPDRLALILPGSENAGRAHALELWPTRRAGGRSRRLSAAASGAARRHQSAIRPHRASG